MADGDTDGALVEGDSPEETSSRGQHQRCLSEAATEDFASIPGSSRSRSSSCTSMREKPCSTSEHIAALSSTQLVLPASALSQEREDVGEAFETLGKEATSDVDEELVAVEKELTREVPMLLESLNRASSDVNVLERQASDAQERYRHLLEQWSRLHEEMRIHYGHTIDIARPYYEATQAVSVTSQCAQRMVREFSAASSQHTQAKAELRDIEQRLALGTNQGKLDTEQQEGLSRATLRVLKCQQARDKCEREYAKVLRDYQEAQEAVELWRAEIGDAMIRRTWPCFRQLQQHQALLTAAQNRISALVDRTKASKNNYHNSLRELDRINMAVHGARQVSPKASIDSSGSPETLSVGDGPLCSDSLHHERRPPTPPEVSPEPEASDHEEETSSGFGGRASRELDLSTTGMSPFDDEIDARRSSYVASCIRSEALAAPEEACHRKFSSRLPSDVDAVDDGPFA